MPLMTRAQALPLSTDLSRRLATLQPAFDGQPPAADATLYVGWFNEKPICALWASGPDQSRQLCQLALHAANRGRGVLGQFVHEVQALERAQARRVLSADAFDSQD